MPTLPGADAANRPVTFDTTPGPVVRAAAGDAHPVEFPLRTSTVTGGPGEVALDRGYVHRALTLGIREVRIVAADKPVLFADVTRTFLVMSLDSSLIVPRADGAAVTADPLSDQPTPPRRRFPVRPDPRPPTDPDPPADDDPLVAAEELRTTLAAATQAAHRLDHTWVKARKKEHRALTQVWSSLRSLKLPP